MSFSWGNEKVENKSLLFYFQITLLKVLLLRYNIYEYFQRRIYMSKKLMAIDGNSIMNRAFYGLQGSKMLSTSDGLFTNAIYGFLNIVFRYIDEEKPDYICVAFDLKAPTFRHIEYEAYKANRKGMPAELRVQVPVLKDVIDAMNIIRLELEGYEADDILGTVSKYCDERDIEAVIVTGDRDSFQLISEKTRIKIPLTKAGKTQTEEYNLQKFKEVYGIDPLQFIDVKGLMGDSSDNIPGVPGVGDKTALELIKQYGSVEEVLEKSEELNVRKNVKESIMSNKELAILSKRLATIERNVPIEIDLEKMKLGEFKNEKLYELFKRLEFNSLIQKLDLSGQTKTTGSEIRVAKEKDIDNVLTEILKSKRFVYRFYLDHTNKHKVLGIGVYLDDNKVFFTSNWEDESIKSKFKKVFEDDTVSKIGFDIKQDIVALNTYGIGFENIGFDVMIAAYILNPSREAYQLASIVQEYLGVTIKSENELFGSGRKGANLILVEPGAVVEFFENEVHCINELTKIFTNSIDEFDQKDLYYNIELPLVGVLASMQIWGFKVDKAQLEKLSKQLDGKIGLLIGEIYDLAGEEFNINSTKQLGVILFDKLKLPIVKKTKTGYSTDAEVLEILSSQHEIVAKILEYRQLAKLKSTYAEGMISVINPKTGKIHSNFNQTVTQTGRISSTEPNLQNIPVRLEMGRNFRKVFVASSDDYTLVDADYSQIELRVLAHIADDKNMLEAFYRGEDIHRRTASQVFKVKPEDVTYEMRKSAKAVNFGIVYGISDFGLAKDLGITRKDAKMYIDSYLENFTGVKTYMHESVEYGKIKGYVTTLFNRRRYIPELKSSNFNIRSFGERVAMNTPIQGTAADIIKIAMVNIYNELKHRKLKSRLILQVHDELIIETHKDEVEIVKDILKNKMMGAMKLNVSLEIDMNVGSSWYDAK